MVFRSAGFSEHRDMCGSKVSAGLLFCCQGSAGDWAVHRRGGGLLIFAGGLIITVATFWFMPSERILFGILTFIGTAMLALIPASGILRQIPAWAGLTGSGFLFFLTRNINRGYWGFGPVILGSVPEGFYRGWVMTFLGFPKAGFFSGDYFSFFPWIFLYVCGYFLYDIVMRREAVKKLLDCRMGVFEWIGRHSLVIYMLHQPVLMLILECVSRQTHE